jgi:hypothetical protein
MTIMIQVIPVTTTIIIASHTAGQTQTTMVPQQESNKINQRGHGAHLILGFSSRHVLCKGDWRRH